MTIGTDLEYGELDELYLDLFNPRLGRDVGDQLSQDDVLALMMNWSLEELAISYIESGSFWTQEALIVVQEDVDGATRLVVIEGNRRLAALMMLHRAFEGQDVPRGWQEITETGELPEGLFERIPYLLADSRDDISAFVGFRHVTGIKQWRPEEKAKYIVKLPLFAQG